MSLRTKNSTIPRFAASVVTSKHQHKINFDTPIDLFTPPHIWGDINGVEKLRLLCRLIKSGFSPPFEFGTFRGLTTCNMAMNLPDANHKVFTIDSDNQCNDSTLNVEGRNYEHYTVGELYKSKGLEDRVEQITEDSSVMDLSEYYGKFGLVFVDAGHSYGAIKHDSEEAFKLVRSGGVIVWDDYGDYWPDVKRYLDELSSSKELFIDSGLIMYFVP